MSVEIMTALLAFAAVSTVTPGPNNLMLLASGANFGYWRTLPHMFGIALGMVFMVLTLGAGVVGIFEQVAWSYELLKVLCVLYMLYLASKIARAGQLAKDTKARAKPFSFWQAALFQWVNPKAWSMALTAITLYSPERNLQNVALVALAFGFVNLPSVSVWVLMGTKLQRWLSNAKRLRYFNWGMASLLVASLYPVLKL